MPHCLGWKKALWPWHGWPRGVSLPCLLDPRICSMDVSLSQCCRQRVAPDPHASLSLLHGLFLEAHSKNFKKISGKGPWPCAVVSTRRLPAAFSTQLSDGPEAQADDEDLACESLFCEGSKFLRWWRVVEREVSLESPSVSRDDWNSEDMFWKLPAWSPDEEQGVNSWRVACCRW